MGRIILGFLGFVDMDLKPLLDVILIEYELPLNGYHGVSHWARVLENGVKLCEATGGNVSVVSLFAVLHDSRRRNESHDPEHGPRAVEFAAKIRKQHLDLTDHEFALLSKACDGHTHELTHPDITIQTCWDADRLDLGRVGVRPHPARMCTEAAKLPEMINWAHGRGAFGFVPERVSREWGIDLE